MRCVHAILTGILLSTAGPAVFAQEKPAAVPEKQETKSAAKPSQGAPKQDGKSAAKPAEAGKKPVQKAGAKPPQIVPKKARKAAKKEPAPGEKPKESETKVARRDPFESLIGRQQKAGQALPNIPGKPGLVIATLRLDGIVKTPDLMIAIVTNPQQRTYFLREGDQLFDGRVEKIMMDSVSFHEVGKDAFGKPVERQVNKRLYPSPGETQ